MESYEGKEIMKKQEYVSEVGETTEYCFELTKPWQSTCRIDICDLQFGPVKF